MSHRHLLGALIVSVMLVAGMTGTAAAHSWQTEVTVGQMELGISSSPETPVAGMTTEFSARIADSEAVEGQANRTSYGSVTNKHVEVHIRGPNDYHDHVATSIPEDDSHFSFSYLFPTGGEYSLAVVTTIDGEEYAFQFTRDVMLLPADAQGEQLDAVASDVSHVHEEVETTNERLDALSSQVDELESQLESHDQAASSGDNVASAQAPGFTVMAAIAALLAIVAFAAGRRSG